MESKIYTFCLPDIGEGVVEGEIVEWLKNEGDVVLQDEPVVIVMTDKATVELPAPYPGIIQKHYYQAGQIAIKDKPLYDIVLEQEPPSNSLDETKSSKEVSLKPIEKEKKQIKTFQKLSTIQAKQSSKSKPLAIPKVRHLAKDWRIDLNQISGTGPEGRILEEDLHTFFLSSSSNSNVEPLENDVEQPLLGVRGLMAKKMHETRIPQFSFFEYADAVRLIQLRQNMKEKASQGGFNLSFMPFFIRALSLTIKQYPQLNASLNMSENKVLLHQQHHIGIAMASSQGLIVPVLKHVECMGLIEIIKAYEELKIKAKTHKFHSQDMKGATLTISNFGGLEGDGMWASPMISDPEVAILAVARMRKLPVVKEDEVIARETFPLSWSFDHRLIDGDLAAKISHAYCSLIKNPASLL